MKLRIQVSKNYQVVEVEQELSEVVVQEVQAEEMREFALAELDKIIKAIGENNQVVPSNKATPTSNHDVKDPNAIAINSKGYVMTSKDKKELTNGEVKKCAKANIKPWEVTKANIDALL